MGEKKFPCLICNEHVKKNAKAVQCTLCQLWVHVTCQGLAEKCYKVLCDAEKFGGMFWACRSCTAYAIEFNRRILEIDRKLSVLEEKVNNTDIALDTVKTTVEQIKVDVSKMKENTGLENMSSAQIFMEIKDREGRKQNLVFHNLAEPSANTREARVNKDKQLLADVCDQIDVNLIYDQSVKFMTRLGKFTEGKQCPLLVGFNDPRVKRNILEKASKLRSKEGSLSQVFIVQDLTKLQREEEDELFNAAKAKNSSMTEEEKKNFFWKEDQRTSPPRSQSQEAMGTRTRT